MLWVHFYYYYYYFIGTWAEEEGKIDAIKFAFDVYDFKGDGTVDASHADDLSWACRLNTSLKVGVQGMQEPVCMGRIFVGLNMKHLESSKKRKESENHETLLQKVIQMIRKDV